jgi:hypothetical protein
MVFKYALELLAGLAVLIFLPVLTPLTVLTELVVICVRAYHEAACNGIPGVRSAT